MWNFDSFPNNIACIDENGKETTYAELTATAENFLRFVKPRELVFSFCENTTGSLVGYVSFLSNKIVPLLLDSNLESELAYQLIEIYKPSYIWLPEHKTIPEYQVVFNSWGYNLLQTGLEPFSLHNEFALLVTTSGSTGSPKLVRQSYKNIESNTKSIVDYLKIDSTERPITTLPMNYVYGTSIVNSHLSQGATILLTTKGLMQKEFWQFFKDYGATSIAGVPYTYEMLKKLRFTRMVLPSLRTMTQAGGKLHPDLHKEFAEYAVEKNVNFVIMYGAAEATARMGYLPPEKSLEKYGSMGIAIPGGRFDLLDEKAEVIEEFGTVGELVYYGDNVTLGYAENGNDLIKEDERNGRYETGDMAIRDDDGFYTIVGRKKRFLKIFGNRVGLDETERMLNNAFPNIECACSGVDDKMTIYTTDAEVANELIKFLAEKTGLNPIAFNTVAIEKIPRNEAGKVLYSELRITND
jgi:acyl-coenzyme A synthetase/AMP-(fatty) acid ligase